MTLQEIFQTSATRLLEQNQVSQADLSTGESGGKCLYFHPQGLGCAVGLLFRDNEEVKSDVISKNLNSAGVMELLKKSEAARKFFGISDARWIDTQSNQLTDEARSIVNFLRSLQDIHDSVTPQGWRENLKKCGETYALDTSFLDERVAA